MDKLQKFIDYLNDEEMAWVKEYKKTEKEKLLKATPEEAANLIAMHVIYTYLGLDRSWVITKEQTRRWQEVRAKTKELGFRPSDIGMRG